MLCARNYPRAFIVLALSLEYRKQGYELVYPERETQPIGHFNLPRYTLGSGTTEIDMLSFGLWGYVGPCPIKSYHEFPWDTRPWLRSIKKYQGSLLIFMSLHNNDKLWGIFRDWS